MSKAAPIPANARIAILISGTGSNMQAFIEACDRGELTAQIAVVISNNPNALGLQRAAEAGIATASVNHRDYGSRESFDQALVNTLNEYDVDLVILAGFMRILTPIFIGAFADRLLNIHPSLLPKYPGLHTHQRALDAGDKEAGVTVHFVIPELDAGPAVIQARVAIRDDDTAASLATRVLVAEHKIYPLAAQWFLTGRLKLTVDGASLDGTILPKTGQQYE